MEKTPQKKASKQPKAAAKAAAAKSRKQLKVVYISNPMKVETSPAKFRALVQELTGQDADVPGPYKFPPGPGVGVGGRSGGEVAHGSKVAAEEHSGEAALQHGSSDVPAESSDLSSETAPDYVPELIEDFPGIMPSNMWYD